MASIVKDPGGKKRLQYTDPSSGKKSTIRLGKLEVRQAETVRTKVEALLSASITGSLDAETSRWVAAIDDRLHRKLAAKGLVQPRARASHTLGALLDEYFRSVEVKPSTATTYKQTRRSLEDHFGANKPLQLITPLEADRWRQSLREEGLAEATVAKRVKTARQTELVETFPLHVVCAWLGNTPAIAQGHYLQVHDAHFERAAGGSDAGVAGSAAGVAPAKATQKATPHAAELRRTVSQSPSRAIA